MYINPNYHTPLVQRDEFFHMSNPRIADAVTVSVLVEKIRYKNIVLECRRLYDIYNYEVILRPMTSEKTKSDCIYVTKVNYESCH